MSDILFDEERALAPAPRRHISQAALSQLVIKWGFAKDEKGAQTVLISIVVVSVILAIAAPLLMRQKDVPLAAPVVPLPFAPNGR